MRGAISFAPRLQPGGSRFSETIPRTVSNGFVWDHEVSTTTRTGVPNAAAALGWWMRVGPARSRSGHGFSCAARPTRYRVVVLTSHPRKCVRDLEVSVIKALVKYESGVGHVELRDVEEPNCGDEQVKIEVSYCGVCGTDRGGLGRILGRHLGAVAEDS